MILTECSVNALLLSSPCFVPSASLTKWKKRAPPVDLSILLLRQLDRFHVRRVCGCHPVHLTLSGTRCLGQVLILSQVELLSERAHIKDSPQKDFELKTHHSNPASAPGLPGQFP